MCFFGAVAHQSSMQELDLLNPQLDPRITFSRASTKTYFGSNGLMQAAAADQWPLEYDPITLQPIGRSVWEQRTNLLLYSNDVSNAAWIKTNIAATANALVVKGISFSKIEATTTGGLCYQIVNGAGASSGNTWSFLIKKGNGKMNLFTFRNDTTSTNFLTFKIDLDTGAITYIAGSSGVSSIDIGDGVWKVTVFNTASISSGNALRVYLGEGSGNTVTIGDYSYIANLQLEAGTFASPYIPTAASQVTRVADAVTEADLAAMRFNASNGTLRMVATAPLSVAAAATLASLNDNTGSEVVRLHMEAGGALKAQVIDNGVTVADMTLGTLTGGQSVKVALAFASNDIAGCLNGGTVQTDTSATLPTVDRLMLGRGASGNYWNSGLTSAKLYPERLANSELQAITA